MKKTHSTFCRVLAIATGMLILAGCNDGDGSGPEGSSTVQGNVSSFSVNGVSSVPGAGTGVHMQGTDLSTTTDENGYFIMSGVPPGIHQMQFLYQGQKSTVDVDVPDDGVVTMQNIQCYGQQNATVGHMNVQMNNRMDSNGMPGSGNAMHGNNPYKDG